MKILKKGIVLFIASIVMISSLIGCTPSESEEVQAPSVDNLGELPEKFDNEVTITTVRHMNGDVLFRDGETIEDNVHTRWVKDKFNINLKYLWTTSGPQDAFKTKIRLELSSNQELPDLIALRDDDVARDLINSGKFMEVGEVYEKYASPTWKAAMGEDPSVWYPYSRDGKKMGIPILDYSYNGDPVLWIREDWLQKLNLEAPKTLADLEKVMDAFVNQDPDGNGQKDTYGLTLGFKNNVNTWMSDTSWVFGMFGTVPRQWNIASDGTLEYGSIHPGAKQALGTIKSWMEKGYIHKESALWDEIKASELFTSGMAGIIAGPHWMPHWPLPDLAKNVPGAEYKAYPIPAGPDGKVGRHGTQNFNGVVLINKNISPESLKAFFVYQNYLFENYANPAEGGEFQYGMFEGYDYVMKDGKGIPNEEDDRIDPVKYTLTFDGARIPSLTMTTLAKLGRGEEPSTPYERVHALHPKAVAQAALVVLEQKDASKKDAFLGGTTPTMVTRIEALNTMEKEHYNNIIYGKTSIDEFDSFVEQWKSAGGQKIIEEVNEWYKKVTQ